MVLSRLGIAIRTRADRDVRSQKGVTWDILALFSFSGPYEKPGSIQLANGHPANGVNFRLPKVSDNTSGKYSDAILKKGDPD